MTQILWSHPLNHEGSSINIWTTNNSDSSLLGNSLKYYVNVKNVYSLNEDGNAEPNPI